MEHPQLQGLLQLLLLGCMLPRCLCWLAYFVSFRFASSRFVSIRSFLRGPRSPGLAACALSLVEVTQLRPAVLPTPTLTLSQGAPKSRESQLCFGSSPCASTLDPAATNEDTSESQREEASCFWHTPAICSPSATSHCKLSINTYLQPVRSVFRTFGHGQGHGQGRGQIHTPPRSVPSS